jgi:excinuclease ABC subunit C
MALAAARDVGIDLRPGSGLPIIALAKERDLLAQEEPATLPAAVTVVAESAPAPANDTGELAGAPTPPPPKKGTRRKSGKGGGATEATLARRPDRVFLPNAKDPIAIRPNSAEMFVLAHLRDEAHRFAVAFHRGQRKRRTLRSALSDITGIGVTRQRELLRHFGSVRKIREATLDELAAVPGIGRKAAAAVRAYFDAHGELAPPPGPASVEAPAQAADEDAVDSAFAEAEAEVEPEPETDAEGDAPGEPDPGG